MKSTPRQTKPLYELTTHTHNNMQINLFIHTDQGSYQHGFHLGTELPLAKQIAEDVYQRAEPKIGNYIRAVRLTQNNRLHSFDGISWSRIDFPHTQRPI